MYLIFTLILLALPWIQCQNANKSPPLPNPALVGYANWNQCDDTILQSVEQGTNVVIWFTITISVNPATKKPIIQGGPDYDCVGRMVSKMNKMGYTDVVHLMAIGGWGVDHPPDTINAQDMLQEFKRWNQEVVARPQLGWYGFHGIDWDIEGNDNVSSPFNTLSVALLDFMGSFSQLLRSNGYYVSMVPVETCLTPSIHSFSLSLTHSNPQFHPEYTWHGKNAYAYLLAQFVDAFDLVIVQLYESYGPMLYNTTVLKQSKSSYMENAVSAYESGWEIDFTTETATRSLGKKTVNVPPSQLILGLQNGDWVNDIKTILIPADVAGKVFQTLRGKGKDLRGFAVWSMRDEGVKPNITGVGPLYLARGLNKYLMIRGNFTQQNDPINKADSNINSQERSTTGQNETSFVTGQNQTSVSSGWMLQPSCFVALFIFVMLE